ncbi:MAG TPA: GNAT family protein [Verrucomicrobiae bacterium]|nr:GNAT family protein [Verrucomicrobiae bacterium]
MEHTLKAEGFGVRLRPVRMEDAAFIVWLRNLDHVKGRVGDTSSDTATQEAWLKTYFKRDGDYYFIVETAGGIAVGAYGIYDVDAGSAESGRWVIQPEVPAAIPSAMLAFDLAFGVLRLKEVRVTTVSTNQPVLSLNRRFGFSETGVDRGGAIIGGKPVDLVRFLLKAAEWPKPREKMLPLARLAEAQVRDWESRQTQKQP